MVKMEAVMKKIWMIALLAVATAFSCAKIDEQETVDPAVESVPEKTAGRIVFNIQVNQAGAQTKAVKTGWETGDVVYVFFNNVTISDTPKYATLTCTASGWDAAFSDGWDGTGLEESGATMSAVRPFPFRSRKMAAATLLKPSMFSRARTGIMAIPQEISLLTI